MTLLYRCDVCQTIHDTEAEAVACEAQGTPEPPHWLATRVGHDVAAFGENGVRVGKLREFSVAEHNGKHDLRVDFHGSVSHNVQYGDDVPVCAFDPMLGYDYCRYAEVGDMADEAKEWARWCRAYDIEPDPTKAAWWRDAYHFNAAMKAAFLAALEQR